MMKKYFILMGLVFAMSVVVNGATLYVKPASGTSGNGLTSVTANIDNPGAESIITNSTSDYRIQEPPPAIIIEDNTENIASADIAPNPLLASISDFCIQLPPPAVIIEDNTENIASADIAPNPLLASISDYRIQESSSDIIIEDNTDYTADTDILNIESGIALTEGTGVLKIIDNPGNLSAYAISNTELKVMGNVSAQAMATLYDIQGHAIITKKLSIGDTNSILMSTVKNGIYMLLVKDNGITNSFKLFVMD